MKLDVQLGGHLGEYKSIYNTEDKHLNQIQNVPVRFKK
jgi:hypothetical protein